MSDIQTTAERNATTKAALWVAVVFILGAALGGILGYVFAYRSYASVIQTDAAKRQVRVQQLTQELNLTTQQQQQLDKILTEMQGQFRDIRKQVDPQIDAARQKGRNQIRAILTPQQLPTFEDFLRRLDEERKRNSQ
jgi:Spy/CpxP family protein refolding chaperone